MRRRLAQGVRMYTGDDFNYAELIAGDGQGHHADALLGIFDAIAPAASAALAAPRAGRRGRFDEILAPTVPLVRHIFERAHPLLQNRRRVPGLPQRPPGPFRHARRPAERPLLLHLAELFRLADQARVLRDPELAASRMSAVLAVGGIA